MLVLIEIVDMYLFLNLIFSFKARVGLAKTKCASGKIHAGLVCSESDYLQCYSLLGA